MSDTNQNSYSVEIDYQNDQVNYYDHIGNYIADTSELIGKGTLDFFQDFKNTTVGDYSKFGGKLLFWVDNGFKFGEYLNEQSGTSSADVKDYIVAGSQTAVRVATTDVTSWAAGSAAAAAAFALMPATAGLSALIIVPGIVGAGIKVTTSYIAGEIHDNSNIPVIVAEKVGKAYDAVYKDKTKDTIIGVLDEKNSQSQFKVSTEENKFFVQTSTPLTEEQKAATLQAIAPLIKPTNDNASPIESIILNDDEYIPFNTDLSDYQENNLLIDGETLDITQFQNDDGSNSSFLKNQEVTLADGSTSSSSVIVNMLTKSKEALEAFANKNFVKNTVEYFSDTDRIASWSADVIRLLANGEKIDDIIKFIAVKEIVNGSANYLVNDIVFSDETIAAMKDIVADDAEGILSESLNNISDSIAGFLESSAGQAFANFASSFIASIILSGEDLNSEEYLEHATQIIGTQIASELASSAIETSLANASGSIQNIAASGGAAAAVYIAAKAISDMFAEDSMNSHQWQSTINMAVGIGVATVLGNMLFPGGGMVAAAILTIAVGGATFEEGEYPTPYDFLKIIPKDDGSGNTIYALESDGTIAKARDTFDDDIIGSRGDDVLVGGDGTNVIAGNAGNDHIEGRDSDDQLIGGEGNDLIEAGAGDDAILGNEGNDIIHAGAGNDQIDAGAGDDIIISGTGNDIVVAGDGNDFISGEAGNDQISAGTGDDTINGGSGSDILFGEEGRDRIYGGEDNDTIEGGAGEDILIGGLGSDTINAGNDDDIVIGGAGVDMLYGDAGADTISGGDDNDLIYGGLGNDQLNGADGDDSILGEIGDDQIAGGAGIDTISGGDGQDIIAGNTGDDILDGGAGDDVYIFNNGDGADEITDNEGDLDVIRFRDLNSADVILTKSGDDLIISFASSSDQITIKDNFQSGVFNPTIESIEFVQTGVSGGKNIDLLQATYDSVTDSFNFSINDTISEDVSFQQTLLDDTIGATTALDNYYHDLQGIELNYNEDLYANIDYEFYNEIEWRSYKKTRGVFGGHYTAWYKHYEKNIEGTDGADRLVGNFWDEIINGNAGNDFLYGNAGNDEINGAAGDDYLEGGSGDDTLSGGIGNDNLEGGSGNDTLNGEDGNDVISAGSGDDIIFAGSGNDTISAEFGNNTIYAGAGNNYIESGAGNDNVTLLDGDNIANLGDGENTITAGSGANFIEAGNGNDNITAGDGANNITSAAGDDIISVGSGNNNIYSGSGNDNISAGNGNNTIYAGAGDDVLNIGSGNNIIYLGYGDDTLTIGSGINTIYADNGNNIINVVTSSALANANFSSLSLDTNSLANDEELIISTTVETGYGNDVISIENGDATINTGAGDDIITLGAGDHIIDSNSGNNQITIGDGNSILTLADGNNIVNISSGNNNLTIGDGNNLINLNQEARNFNADYYRENYGDQIPDYGLSDSENALKHFNEVGKYQNYNPNQYFNSAIYSSSLIANSLALAENQTLFDHFNEIGYTLNLAHSDTNQTNVNHLSIGDGDNIVIGDSAIDIITIGDGNNEINSHNGADIIEAGNGNNTINSGNGNDQITLGDGDNIIKSDAGHDEINLGNGNNIVNSGLGNDQINAGDGDNQIITGEGNDIISLGNGNNNINTGQGNDIISAGTGDNTYVYYLGDGNDIISETGGNDSLELKDLKAQDITLTKSDNALLVNIKANGAIITISDFFLNSGNTIDNIKFSDGFSINLSDIFIGSDAKDLVTGDDNDNQIIASDGNDIAIGLAGNDYLDGGDGNDLIYGGAGDDILIGGNGNDYLDAGAGADQISASAGNDILFGGSGSDTFIINKIANSHDVITDFSITEDILDLTDFGSEFVNLESLLIQKQINEDDNGNCVINFGDDQTLTLTGISIDDLANIDINFAANSHNSLIGTNANNIISGTENADEIYTNGGSDVLTGNAGADKFIITKAENTISFIEDFSIGEDTLKFSDMDIVDFNQLNLEQINNHTIINFNSQKIILKNINKEQLSADDFEFSKFNGVGEYQRYSGDYAITESNVIENNIGITAGEIDYFMANEASAGFTGSSYESVNFYNSANIYSEGGELLTTTDFYDMLQKGWLDQIYTQGWDNDRSLASNLRRNGGHARFEINLEEIYYHGYGHDYVHSAHSFHRYYSLTGNNIIDVDFSQYITTGSGNDWVYGFNSASEILLGNGNDHGSGGNGDDIIYGDNGHDLLVGNNGNDTLHGGSGNDNLQGGDGNDYLNGNAGDDNLFGGTGNDEMHGAEGNDYISGEDGNDIIYGGAGSDQINGGNGDDYIHSGHENDSVNAGGGNDTVAGGYGDDYLDGGAGNDLLAGEWGNDVIQGNAGNDTVHGNDGNDLLYGGIGNDTLGGGDGDDYLDGGFGSDYSFGEDGNDYIIGGSDGQDDLLSGGTGHDNIIASTGNNLIDGGTGADKIQGGSGNDIIYGNSGEDIINAGAGSDIVYGGTNQDIIYGESGNDYILGGQAGDILFGNEGNDLIEGGLDADTLFGGAGEDYLDGGTGHDYLNGGSGNDILLGFEGNDSIEGNSGNDILDGGVGSDIYFYNIGDGHDIIIDKYELGSNDIISFGSGITKDQIKLQQDGLNLIISLNNNLGSLTIIDQFHSDGYAIEKLLFIDGDELLISENSTPIANLVITDANGELNNAAKQIGSFLMMDEDNQIKIPLANGQSLKEFSSNGSLVAADNYLIYSPEENHYGITALEFELKNLDGSSTQYNFTIAINPVNDAPIANIVAAELDEDSNITIDVIANSFDIEDGTNLSLIATDAKHGTVEITEDNKLLYTPNANYYGNDSFEYIITDQDGLSTSKTINIVVNNIDDVPIVVDELNVQTSEDKTISIDILANVFDADHQENGQYNMGVEDINGNTLNITEITGAPLNGVAEISDNKITYTPNPNFNGTDVITYKISDGVHELTKVINLEITPENDVPIIINSETTTNEDGTIIIDILRDVIDADGDNLTITSISQPDNGAAEIINNKIVYVPKANYHGTDALLYTIADGNGGFVTKKLDINVTSINDAPIIESFASEINEDGVLTIDVLKGAFDIEDDDLTISQVSSGSHGIATIINNKIIYVPNANYHGADTIEYIISDGTNEVSKILNINIDSINDAPVAILSEATLEEDNSITLDILSFASDLDGDTLSLTGITSPNYGSAEIINGKVKYTPNIDYFGNDSFEYFITDNNGALISKTLTLTINNVNDIPLLNTDDHHVTYEDSKLEIDVLLQTIDLDGDTLTIESVTDPLNGLAEIIDGKIIYTPNGNYNGSDNFSYTISDGSSSITKDLTVYVNAMNDSPNAIDDHVETLEDNDIIIDVLNNDFDVEDADLKRENILFGGAMNGLVFLNKHNQIIYRPNKNFNGTDEFVYSVKDSNAAFSNLATVSINIDPVNDQPIIQQKFADQMIRAGEENIIKISEKTFFDIDGDELDISLKMHDGSDLPDWLIYDANSQTITTNATNDDIGKLHLSLIASDGEYEVSSKFTLVVKESLEVRNDERINIIEGGSESDLMVAETGNTDLIFAGDGDDDIVYNIDDVWGEGFQAFNSYTGDVVDISGKIRSYDAFDGGAGDADTLYLTEGDDSVFLHDLISDNPTISGSRLFGIEVINALGGSDIIDLSSDVFTYGSVTINGSDGDDVIWSNDGNDTINAGSGDDNLNGGRGDDILYGDVGDDYIHGYDGDDTLIGGIGQDILIGGSGSDIFEFTGLAESTIAKPDIIKDFESGIDLIKIAGVTYDDLSINVNENSTIVANDNFALELEGIFNLTEDDFIAA